MNNRLRRLFHWRHNYVVRERTYEYIDGKVVYFRRYECKICKRNKFIKDEKQEASI